ncbi:MAG: HAD-IA family hydrolase [Candidatus Acidiferrales bacterium]
MTRILCSALLFDMDGVLVDSTPAVARVWAAWAAKYGFDPDFVVRHAHGRPSLVSIQELLPHASPEAHLAEDLRMQQAEIDDVADVVALPGAANLLSQLPLDRFAVVTSAVRELAEVRLRAAGILHLVRHMVTASDIRHGKPDPEPYLQGAAALGFSPANCIVIEDAPSGVRSGEAAGSRVIAIRTTTRDPELLASGADWIVNDCASIRLAHAPSPRELALDLADDSRNPRIPQMS